jgi:hypothetical protein
MSLNVFHGASPLGRAQGVAAPQIEKTSQIASAVEKTLRAIIAISNLSKLPVPGHSRRQLQRIFSS